MKIKMLIFLFICFSSHSIYSQTLLNNIPLGLKELNVGNKSIDCELSTTISNIHGTIKAFSQNEIIYKVSFIPNENINQSQLYDLINAIQSKYHIKLNLIIKKFIDHTQYAYSYKDKTVTIILTADKFYNIYNFALDLYNNRLLIEYNKNSKNDI